MRFPLSSWLGLIVLAAPAWAEEAMVRLEPVWEACKIQRPVSVVSAPDGSDRPFLVQQRGQIMILPADRRGSDMKVFLDVSDRKLEENEFEEGLLGLAFHPRFKENGCFFIYYTQQDPKRSVVAEWRVAAGDSSKADPATERILMEVPQPFWNHKSGNLLFGPDGMLYIALGDGGKRDDVTRFAQNLFALHGKILRIDIDSRSGARAYGIPKDNPFVGKEGTRPEIWASGLRNPWGISIDRETGLFWCADVGQDLWEEIDLIVKGGNYGWSFREGARPFALRKDPPPEGSKFIEPIHEYLHTQGISITGGFVYRGQRLPALRGRYIYGDWGSGRLWSLNYDANERRVIDNKLLLEPELDEKGAAKVKPTAFCEDASGEILVLNWNGGIQQMVPPK
ncbi:MAG: PQQ-dependent sugar dehydrogenase [Verrucomicrobiales bacterium]